MDKHVSVREWIENFSSSKYDPPDFTTQVSAGWYDWFCQDGQLANRLKKFGKIFLKISNPFLLDEYRVSFKNNCPAIGPTYDSVTFIPLDEAKRNELAFGFSVKDKRRLSPYVVWAAKNKYRDTGTFDSMSQLIKFLNEWNG